MREMTALMGTVEFEEHFCDCTSLIRPCTCTDRNTRRSGLEHSRPTQRENFGIQDTALLCIRSVKV